MESARERLYRGELKRPWGSYCAQINRKKMCIWLGTFDTHEEAALAYDRAARNLQHGAKAKTIFPLNLNMPSNHRFLHTANTQVNGVQSPTDGETPARRELPIDLNEPPPLWM